MMRGQTACSVWVLLKSGKIESIEGLDKLKAHKNVHFVVERFKQGDIVKEEFLGTERQVLFRIYTAGDSIFEINQTIEDIQSILKITDSKDNDMVLEWLKLWNTKDYIFDKN